jgi:hypothetical protein
MLDDLWNSMLRRSFDPRDWFDGSRPQRSSDDDPVWYYRRVGDGFEVGYQDHSGRWRSDGYEYTTRSEASDRARSLNQGYRFGMV